ncbi:uncharacterized protein PAC_03307 [Phialocephala subalpina]|uniref:Calpain catalytic domain-containing protein n=1 Tax=Phialocephala subalpina TaxID=576137 RepID=A0A1L7WKY5_9HELO|nr:uncharacterized protein PAC_03307 [Phialocephala subalpina]
MSDSDSNEEKGNGKAIVTPKVQRRILPTCFVRIGHGPKDLPAAETRKRIKDILEKPSFFVDGAAGNDVRQGHLGNCWIAVVRSWPSALEISGGDFDDEAVTAEQRYRELYQRNSHASYFGKCQDPNKTWFPLLEKAYAKAHGDYSSIQGGAAGDAFEDLTGGVTTSLLPVGLLDKTAFWNQLTLANKELIFCCSSQQEERGLVSPHVYSVFRALETHGKRLLLIRNPHGQGEWTGAWSDGSKEWTPEWMFRLDHRFGDDGLFSDDRNIAQMWTCLDVPYMTEYNKRKFSFTLSKAAPDKKKTKFLAAKLKKRAKARANLGEDASVIPAARSSKVDTTKTNSKVLKRTTRLSTKMSKAEEPIIKSENISKTVSEVAPNVVVDITTKSSDATVSSDVDDESDINSEVSDISIDEVEEMSEEDDSSDGDAMIQNIIRDEKKDKSKIEGEDDKLLELISY